MTYVLQTALVVPLLVPTLLQQPASAFPSGLARVESTLADLPLQRPVDFQCVLHVILPVRFVETGAAPRPHPGTRALLILRLTAGRSSAVHHGEHLLGLDLLVHGRRGRVLPSARRRDFLNRKLL